MGRTTRVSANLFLLVPSACSAAPMLSTPPSACRATGAGWNRGHRRACRATGAGWNRGQTWRAGPAAAAWPPAWQAGEAGIWRRALGAAAPGQGVGTAGHESPAHKPSAQVPWRGRLLANWRGSGLQARQRAPDAHAAASRRGAGSRHRGPGPWPRQAHAQRHRASASSHLDVDAPNTPATHVEERRHIPVDATVLVLRRYATTRKASRSLEKPGTS
jgi:hypothetical protein